MGLSEGIRDQGSLLRAPGFGLDFRHKAKP